MNRVNWLCSILLATRAWCVCTVFAGCAHDTLVFNGEYLIPIQHLCKDASIVSFTTDWKFVATKIRHRSVPHPCKQLVKLTLEGGESVTVQQHQKFLLFDTHEWTCAHYLMSGSRLVRIGSDPCVVVDVCETSEQYAYEMDVGGPHTFFITRWFLLTHNTDLSLVMTTVTTDGILASVAGTSFCATLAAMLTSCGIKATVTGGTLSLTAPISGPFVLAACVGACAGYIFYQAYDWFYGLLSLSKVRDVIQFAERVKPSIIEQVQAGHQEKYHLEEHYNTKDKKDKNREKNTGQSTTGSGGSQEPQEPKKRNTDKVGNIQELFKRDGFGKDLQQNSEPTHGSYNGSRIHRVIEDMPQYNLRRGDLFYLDTLHYDHLEVFNAKGDRQISVLNLDGSLNSEKFYQASMKPRRAALK